MERYGLEQSLFSIKNLQSRWKVNGNDAFTNMPQNADDTSCWQMSFRRLSKKFEKDRPEKLWIAQKSNIPAVRNSIDAHLKGSTQRQAQELGLSYRIIRLIMREELRLHFYRFTQQRKIQDRHRGGLIACWDLIATHSITPYLFSAEWLWW